MLELLINVMDFSFLKKHRKHANYFEAPSKEEKENTVAEEWLNSYGIDHDYDQESLVICNDEWPDCEVKMKSGCLCGIEVTELVNKQCIENKQKGQEINLSWRDEDIIKGIESRLKDKNSKSHGGKYEKLILLLHTDEDDIAYSRGNKIIESHTFSGFHNINEAYLVYSSYEPNKGYPVSIINLD